MAESCDRKLVSKSEFELPPHDTVNGTMTNEVTKTASKRTLGFISLPLTVDSTTYQALVVVSNGLRLVYRLNACLNDLTHSSRLLTSDPISTHSSSETEPS